MRRQHLRLVGSSDPTDVFDDLAKLREQHPAPSARRARCTETFARIPHDRALDLRHLSGTAWVILIELDRLILKSRGRNPVRFVSPRLRKLGINRKTRSRALRQLVAAGVILVEKRGRGQAPWVTHLWYPRIG